MKVLLFGKNKDDIMELVKNSGFELVDKDPDVIISFGGDGTLLSAERVHPAVPKLPIRNSQFCHKCPRHQDKQVLQDLLQGILALKEYKKLHTNLHGSDLYALNDFVIRNEQPIHAIRFSLDHAFYIGDGIVVATPFGSTAYFKSVTGESFNEGFGVAFNNTTAKVNPLYLTDDKNVVFSLIRGEARLSFDNNPDVLQISEGTEVTFNLSNQVARIYESSLRCPNCQVIRG